MRGVYAVLYMLFTAASCALFMCAWLVKSPATAISLALLSSAIAAFCYNRID